MLERKSKRPVGSFDKFDMKPSTGLFRIPDTHSAGDESVNRGTLPPLM
jgi:hypothetical protein